MQSISDIYVNCRENEVLQRAAEAQYPIGHSEKYSEHFIVVPRVKLAP